MFQIRLIPIVSMVLILLLAIKLNDAAKHIIYSAVVTDSYAADTTGRFASSAKEKGKEDATLIDKDDSLYKPDNDPSKVSTAHESYCTVIQNLRRDNGNLDVFTTKNLTDTEVDILQGLAKRREELDQRESDITLREDSLKVLYQNIEGKITELNSIQSKVDLILKEYKQKEEEKTTGLVKVYETMKPQDAARIFDQLDMKILIDVTDKMKESSLALILSKMDPYRAKELTIEIANRRKLQEPTTP